MLARSLGMLLSLGRVFLTLCMFILAVLFRGRSMRLCCGFVVFRRLDMCLLHDDCSCWSENTDLQQVGHE
jgi:hypothetical protein